MDLNTNATDPLPWLELAEGATRDAMVERLAQAHLMASEAHNGAQVPHGPSEAVGARRAVRPSVGHCRLTPLEIASGFVFGFAPPARVPVPIEIGTQTPREPREALERAILPALMRPPCLMSFSGGRASSAILAVAVQLARREGLELPVPATNRVTGSGGAEETARQERVIIRLGLTDWVRLEFADELDLVGPVAMRVLRRHGFVWPSSAHFAMPLIEWASGGSLITGLGYDHALGEPGPLVCRDPGPLPWLRPSAQREVRARWTAEAVSRPRSEQQRIGWWGRLRRVQVGTELLRRLGAELRVEVWHPLTDPVFSTLLGELPVHFRSTHSLFGDLLPSDLLARPTTTTPEPAFWGTYSRKLAEAWDGEGVNPRLVDAEALQRQWSLPHPDPQTFLLLQSVALAQEGPPASSSVVSAEPEASRARGPGARARRRGLRAETAPGCSPSAGPR